MPFVIIFRLPCSYSAEWANIWLRSIPVVSQQEHTHTHILTCKNTHTLQHKCLNLWTPLRDVMMVAVMSSAWTSECNDCHRDYSIRSKNKIKHPQGKLHLHIWRVFSEKHVLLNVFSPPIACISKCITSAFWWNPLVYLNRDGSRISYLFFPFVYTWYTVYLYIHQSLSEKKNPGLASYQGCKDPPF